LFPYTALFRSFVDDDLRCLVGNRNAGLNDVTVHGDDLAIGVLVERPGARIKNFAVCTCHLKPTTAIKRQIELIARVSERALNMELTNGRSAHPKANLCTFRNRALSAAIWSACCPLDLIKKVGKFGARPLVAGC